MSIKKKQKQQAIEMSIIHEFETDGIRNCSVTTDLSKIKRCSYLIITRVVFKFNLSTIFLSGKTN